MTSPIDAPIHNWPYAVVQEGKYVQDRDGNVRVFWGRRDALEYVDDHGGDIAAAQWPELKPSDDDRPPVLVIGNAV